MRQLVAHPRNTIASITPAFDMPCADNKNDCLKGCFLQTNEVAAQDEGRRRWRLSERRRRAGNAWNLGWLTLSGTGEMSRCKSRHADNEHRGYVRHGVTINLLSELK